MNNGVVWLDPARASNKIPPPPVTIQSVSADDRGYRARFTDPISCTHLQRADQLCRRKPFGPGGDSFSLQAARNGSRTGTKSATSNSVSYRNLPPGQLPLRRQCQRHQWVMVRQYRNRGVHCLTCLLSDKLVPRPLRGRFSGAAVGGLPVPYPATAAGIQHGNRSAPG